MSARQVETSAVGREREVVVVVVVVGESNRPILKPAEVSIADARMAI